MPPIDTLPQSPTQQYQGQPPPQPGMDVLHELVSQYQDQTKDIPKLTEEALKPTQVTGAGTSPGLTMNPAQPWQNIPMDYHPVVGAHATKAQGVANAITGLTNLVGNYEQKTQANQQRVLAVDLERTFQAQQGASAAEQALKLNPNDPNAKSALERNNKIIDAMLSDPKRRKQIAKALDINFIDPSQNNSPEHGALKEAVNSYSEQLKAATPSSMQPNQVAVTRLQLAQGQAAATSKMIQTIVPAVIKAQTSVANNQNTNITRRDVAHTTADAHVEAARTMANAHYSAAVDAANIAQRGRLQAVGMQQDGAWNRTMALIQGRMKAIQQKGTDTVKMLQVMQGNNKIWNGYITNLQKQKNQLDLLHINKKIDDGTYQKQAGYIDGQIKTAQDNIQAGQTFANTVATSTIANAPNGQSTTSSSQTASSPAPEHTGATVDTDANEDNPDYYGTGSNQ